MFGRSTLAVALLSTGLMTAAQTASALSIDFDEFEHGDIVHGSQGVVITTTNFDDRSGHPDLGVSFDTVVSGATRDPDLQQEGGWEAGNLAPGGVLNNILIVQENDDCSTARCFKPDDQASWAGSFSFDFSRLGTFASFALDLIDVESGNSENGSIQFLLGGVQVGSIVTFDTLSGLGQGVVYGNNSANHVDLGPMGAFDTVVITLGGSGGIDNVTVFPPVPEPQTAALLGLGLIGLTAAARKRR